MILNWWNKGSITSALNALSMMNDTSIVMDVLNNTFAENQKVDSLNYENIAQVVPHATNLVNSKYETHIVAGLKTSLNIIKTWGPEMIKIKTMPVGGGVDLAREERVKKVDLCIDHFMSLYKSKGFQKALKRQGEVQEISTLLHNHLGNLLNKTRRELETD
jgi:katanin p80 WD40 repeat-containing subunit B1